MKLERMVDEKDEQLSELKSHSEKSLEELRDKLQQKDFDMAKVIESLFVQCRLMNSDKCGHYGEL